MFESTAWHLEELEVSDSSKFDVLVPSIVRNPTSTDNDEQIEIGLIHQFHFSSSLQRMSMITKTIGDPRFIVYTKGSPEMIQSLCIPSTGTYNKFSSFNKKISVINLFVVPSTTNTVLRGYTEEGYRVIALAYKVIEDCNFVQIPKLRREEVECDLIFAGLVILENRLKDQTTPVIKELQGANMKIVMVTGRKHYKFKNEERYFKINYS